MTEAFTEESTPVVSEPSEDEGLPLGAIIGIAVGGAVLLCIVVAVIIVLFVRRRNDKPDNADNSVSLAPTTSPGNHNHSILDIKFGFPGNNYVLLPSQNPPPQSTAIDAKPMASSWVINYNELEFVTELGKGAYGITYLLN